MTQVQLGEKIPSITLPTNGGGQFDSAAQKGNPFVLFFYPKDATPGCTKEAIGFSESLKDFTKLGVNVFGISPDSVASHDKFYAKQNLKVTLLSDEEKSVLEAFGVWKEKSMYGKKYMGVERTTYLVDGEGFVVAVWNKVKVPGHVEAVLEAAKEHFGS